MGFVTRRVGLGILAASFALLSGCTPDYSPNTYASGAVQQANKVARGVVIGFREVKISDDGTVGAVTGGAAGGILATQTDPATVPTALSALGGSLVGGIVGATIQHAAGDTTGWEYIVRETSGDLVSVAQREPKPLAIGQHVLVIDGKQARIVPDYATALEAPQAATPEKAKTDAQAKTAPPSPVKAPSRMPIPLAAVPTVAPASVSRQDAPIVPEGGSAPASANAVTTTQVAPSSPPPGGASSPPETVDTPTTAAATPRPDAPSPPESGR
jgi:outer membrane lipoprotein SlyB